MNRLILFAVLFALIGCAQAAPAAAPADGLMHLDGATIKVDGIRRMDKMTQGAATLTPVKPGDEFVVVALTITASKDFPLQVLNLALVDSSGKAAAFASSLDPNALSNQTIGAGKSVTGTMAYELPKGQRYLALAYQPMGQAAVARLPIR